MDWKHKILVTGVPRSGTTFTGECINLSPEVLYLWEPFNSKSRRQLKQFYPYIGPSSSIKKIQWYRKFISDTINLRKLKSTKTPKSTDPVLIKLIKYAGINRSFINYKKTQIKAVTSSHSTLLIKDPASFFLTNFLIEEFDLSLVASGAYHIKVRNGKKSGAKSFIIE